MIVWLNGPFGVGKTQVALDLHTRLPGSFIFDPEEIGFALNKLTPPHKRLEDFQDYPLWREMVYKTLLYADSSETTLIVPMTLVTPSYFEEVIGGLRSKGAVVNHVALLAPKETILQRLKNRGDGHQSWPAAQLERCLAGLELIAWDEQLPTEGLTVSDVADRVAARFRLELSTRK